MDMTLRLLILLSLSKEWPKNNFQRQAGPSPVEIASSKVCRLLVIERVHRVSSGIVIATFFGTPCMSLIRPRSTKRMEPHHPWHHLIAPKLTGDLSFLIEKHFLGGGRLIRTIAPVVRAHIKQIIHSFYLQAILIKIAKWLKLLLHWMGQMSHEIWNIYDMWNTFQPFFGGLGQDREHSSFQGNEKWFRYEATMLILWWPYDISLYILWYCVLYLYVSYNLDYH